jgi:hypothetical protein
MEHRITLALLAMLFLTQASFAQWSVGVSSGLNTFGVDYYVNNEAARPTHIQQVRELGFFSALGGSYQLKNTRIRLGANLQFNQRTYTWTSMDFPAWSYRYYDLALVPMVEYRVFPFLAVGIGTSLTRALGMRFGESDKWHKPIIELAAPWELGLVGRLKVEHKGFFIAAGFQRGLTNFTNNLHLTDGNGNVVDTNPRNRSETLQLGVGYAYTFD